MQIINHWPASSNLALPETIKKALLTHLIEPFGDNHSAKYFWSEYPSSIIIIDELDTISSLNKLSKITQEQITFAITNPEYTDELGRGYTVKLSIISDDGAGMYLIRHSNNQLIQRLGASND